MGKFVLEDVVKPNPHTAPVTFAERVRNVHFDVLGNDLGKIFLRHLFDLRDGFSKVKRGGKAEVAFGDVDRAKFAREVVNFSEQYAVNLGKRRKLPRRKFFKSPAREKFNRLPFADSFLRAGKFGG